MLQDYPFLDNNSICWDLATLHPIFHEWEHMLINFDAYSRLFDRVIYIFVIFKRVTQLSSIFLIPRYRYDTNRSKVV